jgi:WD40 repeat protein
MRAIVVVTGLLVRLAAGIPSRAQDQRQYEAGVWELAWSPDGTLLAAASFDGYIYVMDVDSNIVAAFAGHPMEAFTVAWNPDGRLLASGGSGDEVVNIWDINTSRLVRRLHPNQCDTCGVPLYGGASQIAWSPDGAHIIATSFDTWQMWGTNSWLPWLQSGGSLSDAQWSPDGSWLVLVTPYSGLYAVDEEMLSTDRIVDGLIVVPDEHPNYLSWHENSQVIAVIEKYDPRISFWDVPSRTRITVHDFDATPFKDISYIAEDRVATITKDGTLYIIDTAGEVLATFQAGVSDVTTLAWNSQEELFAVAGMETILSAEGHTGLALVSLDDVMAAATMPATAP